MQEVDSKMLVAELTKVIVSACEEVKSDIRKIAEKANSVYHSSDKVTVGGKVFDRDELKENFTACYRQLRRSFNRTAVEKRRAAEFCREAAIVLDLPYKSRIVNYCDKIIRRAEKGSYKQ